jgi:hypothetical protein
MKRGMFAVKQKVFQKNIQIFSKICFLLDGCILFLALMAQEGHFISGAANVM